jgi:GH24 family phage-related lysozyme (muramidase)
MINFPMIGIMKNIDQGAHEMHLRDRLRREESFDPHPYPDSKDTTAIGYGNQMNEVTNAHLRKMGINPAAVWSGKRALTEAEGMKLLQHRLASDESKLIHTKEIGGPAEWDRIPRSKQIVLRQMAYQMGPRFTKKFPSMIKAVKRGDWSRAYDEALYKVGDKQSSEYRRTVSDWHGETPARAQRVAYELLQDQPDAMNYVPQPYRANTQTLRPNQWQDMYIDSVIKYQQQNK